MSIHPRLNCVHTHEHNGMVKCWHQYIVEIGLTLLGQCKAPLKFWSYAFETSIYFINRMLTLVLNYKTPFESLFKSTSYYSFLRTFGCLYFPFPRPYNTYKLDFLSSPCVFLGYSTSHLYYRCLDLSSHRIYNARHVQLHEHTFPLATSKHIHSLPTLKTSTFLPQLTSLSHISSYHLPTYLTLVSHAPIESPDSYTPGAPVLPHPISINSHKLSPHASFFVDQCPGTCLASSSQHVSLDSLVLPWSSSILDCCLTDPSIRLGLVLATSPTGSPNVFPPALNLGIDLLHFDLQ